MQLAPWIQDARSKDALCWNWISFLFDREKVFTPQSGSRPNAKKVLIVITDGESTDWWNLKGAVQKAEEKKIIRFAIGVNTSII